MFALLCALALTSMESNDMTTKTTPTQDAQALEAALHALEAQYDIPVTNDFHTLLGGMLAKYRSTLGIDPGYQAGGGTNKTV